MLILFFDTKLQHVIAKLALDNAAMDTICSYGILSLYAIVTQIGSRYKKALIREEIRESLHGWRKRVKEKAKHESLHPSSTPAKLKKSLKSGTRDKDESANVMDGDDTDEDSIDKHLLGSGSSNNGLAFELGVLDDDNIDE
ncbi:hypothetical protein SUGI_0726370 [Cryptomeria japonica]|nr:hypothetical protein SUGI_0726370 [Cryptomeria japonica]